MSGSVLNGAVRSDFTICLDTSGSMYDLLATVKQHVINFLHDVANDDRIKYDPSFERYFNLIEFNHLVTKWSSESVRLIDRTVLLSIEWLLKVGCGTGCELTEALRAAADDAKVREIVVITDAVANGDQWTADLDLSQQLHVILISKERSNEETVSLLKSLAKRSGGSFRVTKLAELKLCDRLPVIYKEDYSTDGKENFENNVKIPTIDESLHLLNKDYFAKSYSHDGLDYILPNAPLNIFERSCCVHDDKTNYPRYPRGNSNSRPSSFWQDYCLKNLLPGRSVLAYRRKDGFFYRGSISSQSSGERFIVKYSSGSFGRRKKPDFEDVSLEDILSLDDALLHPINEGDRVLAPLNGVDARYGPGIVLKGFEGRDSPINGIETSPLLVAFHDGLTKQIALEKAVWISDDLYESLRYRAANVANRVKRDRTMSPSRSRTSVDENDIDRDAIIPGTRITKEQLRSTVARQLSDLQYLTRTSDAHDACNKCERASVSGESGSRYSETRDDKRDKCDKHSRRGSRCEVARDACDSCERGCVGGRSESRRRDDDKRATSDYESRNQSSDESRFDLEEFERSNGLTQDEGTNTEPPFQPKNAGQKKRDGKEKREWRYWQKKPAPSLTDPLHVGRYRAGPYDDFGSALPPNHIENIKSVEGVWRSCLFDVVPRSNPRLDYPTISQSAFNSLIQRQHRQSSEPVSILRHSRSASNIDRYMSKSVALPEREVEMQRAVRQPSFQDKAMQKEQSRMLARRTEVLQREVDAQMRMVQAQQANARREQCLRERHDNYERKNEMQMNKRAEKATGYSDARRQAKLEFLASNQSQQARAERKEEQRIAAKRTIRENRVIDMSHKALRAEQNRIW